VLPVDSSQEGDAASDNAFVGWETCNNEGKGITKDWSSSEEKERKKHRQLVKGENAAVAGGDQKKGRHRGHSCPLEKGKEEISKKDHYWKILQPCGTKAGAATVLLGGKRDK